MIEKVIKFSINNKLFVIITVLFLLIGGLYSLSQLPLDAVPDITNNQVQVVTVSPSSSPQEVEKFITYPIEVSMANILDVTEIRSVSRFGLSVVTIVFKDKLDILKARQLVNEQLQIIASEIPKELGSPEMMPITTGLGEIFQYTLEVEKGYEGKYSNMDLRTIQDWIVKRQLSGIPGIVEISSFGGHLKQYEVAVNPSKLQAANLTLLEVFDALEKNNQNTGGSYIEKNTNAYYIRTEGLLENLDDIGNIVVRSHRGIPILLKNIADIRYGYAQRFGALTKNGKGESVGGITLMLKGANSMTVIKEVKNRIDKVQETLPEGVYIKPYLDRSKLVNNTIKTVSKNLIEGGLIVILILILLLGNFRAGLIVASVIPLSMLFAFIMMNLFGVSANLMSLGAIDFGIVVDGAVIIVESIVLALMSKQSLEKNKSLSMDELVYDSTSKIYKSAAFGVLIILIVFFPIMSLTGIEGKTFKPMAQTVSFTLIGALLLSMTYVPMISAVFLKRKTSHKKNFSDKIIHFLKKSYLPVIRFSLRYKFTVLFTTILVFIASLFMFNRLGGEFMPTLEEGDLAMQMTIHPGSSLQESIKTATKAEKILMTNFPEVEQVISKIGTAEVPTDPMAIEDADIMIILKDKNEWTSAESREELIDQMKEKLDVIPGASFEFTQPIQLRFNELITGAKTDIAIKIYGENIDELYQKAYEASDLIADLEGASDIKIEQITGLPQMVVKYDRLQIARYGLNIQDLNQSIRTAFAGETAGVIFEEEKKFDLVLRLDSINRNQMDISKLNIRLPNQDQIPISEVAKFEYIEGPFQISRDDTRRRVILGINVRNTDIQSLVEKIKVRLQEDLVLKPGYTISYGGQFKNLEDANKRLSVAIPIALSLIMLLLFFTFHSVKYALIIFTAVPLSAVGGIAALAIRGMPFSISAGVGFIALFGVSVLNGIVLISYFNSHPMKDLKKQVINGALMRLRPVMMTALVASFGFLPMAISTSAGAEVQKPLATVVIGGLITATLLTMIILPVLYYIFNTPLNKLFKMKPKYVMAGLLILGLGFSTKGNAQQEISLGEAIQMSMDKHPLLLNTQLEVQKNILLRKNALEIKPLDLSYQKGQINSMFNDQYFEVKQSLGNIPAHFARSAYYQKLEDIAKQKAILNPLTITHQIEVAWYTWIYHYQRLNMLKESHQSYDRFKDKTALRASTGDISALQESLFNSSLEEINRQIQYEEVQLTQSYLNLKSVLSFDFDFTPGNKSFKEIPLKAMQELPEANKHKALIENEIHAMESEIKLQRTGYFPEISLGYFNQQIDLTQGFQGWAVDLSFPLWFFNQKNRVKSARIDYLKARNLGSVQQQQINIQIEGLYKEYAFLKEQEKYYSHTAMQRYDLIVRSAENRLATGEIDIFEYLQSLSAAMNIKQAALDNKYTLYLRAADLKQYQ